MTSTREEKVLIFFTGGIDSTLLLIRAVNDLANERTIIPVSFVIGNNKGLFSHICEKAARSKILTLLQQLEKLNMTEPRLQQYMEEREIEIHFYGSATAFGQYGTWLHNAATHANYKSGVREIQLGTLIDDENAVYALKAQETVFPVLAQISHVHGEKVKLSQPFIESLMLKRNVLLEICDLFEVKVKGDCDKLSKKFQLYREIVDAMWWCEKPIVTYGEVKQSKTRANIPEITQLTQLRTCGKCESCIHIKRSSEDLLRMSGFDIFRDFSIDKTFVIQSRAIGDKVKDRKTFSLDEFDFHSIAEVIKHDTAATPVNEEIYEVVEVTDPACSEK